MDYPLIAFQQASSYESHYNIENIPYHKITLVMNLIYSFYENIKNQTIHELDCMKKDGEKFSITTI